MALVDQPWMLPDIWQILHRRITVQRAIIRPNPARHPHNLKHFANFTCRGPKQRRNGWREHQIRIEAAVPPDAGTTTGQRMNQATPTTEKHDQPQASRAKATDNAPRPACVHPIVSFQPSIVKITPHTLRGLRPCRHGIKLERKTLCHIRHPAQPNAIRWSPHREQRISQPSVAPAQRSNLGDRSIARWRPGFMRRGVHPLPNACNRMWAESQTRGCVAEHRRESMNHPFSPVCSRRTGV